MARSVISYACMRVSLQKGFTAYCNELTIRIQHVILISYNMIHWSYDQCLSSTAAAIIGWYSEFLKQDHCRIYRNRSRIISQPMNIL
jgi:hypothetical protein